MDSKNAVDLAPSQSVSGLTPTPSTHLIPAEEEAPSRVALAERTALASPEARPPTPTTARTLALIANLLGDADVDAVEAALVGVREAWQRGDQSAIADALITQAALLEVVGVKLLRISGTEKHLKAVQAYGNLAFRALEQARKTLATVASLGEKPRIQTNVQVVNVAGPEADRANEKLVNDHGQ